MPVRVTLCCPASSLKVTLLIVAKVGGSFFALTVSVNVRSMLVTPSPTVIVMFAEPDKPAAGVTVSVRLDPVPPGARFTFGTSVTLADVALTARLAAVVSGSEIANGMEIGTSSSVA